MQTTICYYIEFPLISWDWGILFNLNPKPMEDLYLDLYVASWFDDIEYYEKLEKEWQEYCELNER